MKSFARYHLDLLDAASPIPPAMIKERAGNLADQKENKVKMKGTGERYSRPRDIVLALDQTVS